MHVGMLGRQFPGLARAAAEIEFWKRLLVRARPDMRAGQFVKFSFEVYRSARGPQRFQDRDFLLHQLVTLFLRIAHALAFDLALVLAGDQIDADAPARHLVEGRDHLRQQHRVDVAGPCRNQRLDGGRTRRHERARDPGFPAHRADRDQKIFETGRFRRLHHAVAQFGRARNLRIHQAIGGGVAMRGQIPAEFERTHETFLPVDTCCRVVQADEFNGCEGRGNRVPVAGRFSISIARTAR